MALIVSQGPLPDNFEQLYKATDLETWVNNSSITNLPIDAFDFSFGLIVSQTDAPADTRRGLLWFKRGEGHLYFRDDPDRGDSRYTSSPFVSIAPNRELLVAIDLAESLGPNEAARRGAVMSMAFDNTETGTLDRFYRDTNGRQISYACPNQITPDTTVISNWSLLAQDTQVSGFEVRALEWGYGLGLMGSGASSVAGRYLKAPNNSAVALVGTTGEDYAFHCRQTDVSETDMRLFAICVHSSGVSEDLHVLEVFKRPTGDVSWYE